MPREQSQSRKTKSATAMTAPTTPMTTLTTLLSALSDWSGSGEAVAALVSPTTTVDAAGATDAGLLPVIAGSWKP